MVIMFASGLVNFGRCRRRRHLAVERRDWLFDAAKVLIEMTLHVVQTKENRAPDFEVGQDARPHPDLDCPRSPVEPLSDVLLRDEADAPVCARLNVFWVFHIFASSYVHCAQLRVNERETERDFAGTMSDDAFSARRMLSGQIEACDELILPEGNPG